MPTATGGQPLSDEDFVRVVVPQRVITKQAIDTVLQLPVTALLSGSKIPKADDWGKTKYKDNDVSAWADGADGTLHINYGIIAGDSWIDLDIDSGDPEFARIAFLAFDHLNIDTRLRFGRMSAGRPTHAWVRIEQHYADAFDTWRRLKPKRFLYNGMSHDIETRYSVVRKGALYGGAHQTVAPGSVYDGGKDPSVWYARDNSVASKLEDMLASTPRRNSYRDIVVAIAFASLTYMLKDKWIEGSRQETARIVGGWLARRVAESSALQTNAFVNSTVLPVFDSPEVAASFVNFVCATFNDEEPDMRLRAFTDAARKLERNPLAELPGEPAMRTMLGDAFAACVRGIIVPGTDTSPLMELAEKYVYVRSTDEYVDRTLFDRKAATYSFMPMQAARANAHLRLNVPGPTGRMKAIEAFKAFEGSTLRVCVDDADCFPNHPPGEILRVRAGRVIDIEDERSAILIYNTWRGFPHEPIEQVDPILMDRCIGYLTRLLGLLTNHNQDQMEWIRQWFAQLIQRPGTKLHKSLVIVGGQGVGKTFFMSTFAHALLGELVGSASIKQLEGQFAVSAFIGKLLVYMDEVTATEASADSLKLYMRNDKIAGEQKGQDAKTFNIMARLCLLSNRPNVNPDRDKTDRAMFYVRAEDQLTKGLTEKQFHDYAEGLKPFFNDFAAFLADETVVRHFMRYFADYEFDPTFIDSLKLSSSRDEELMRATATGAELVAIEYVENAGFDRADGRAWCQTFDMETFTARVRDHITFHNLQRRVSLSNVLDRLLAWGIVVKLEGGYKHAHKWGTALAQLKVEKGLMPRPYRAAKADEIGMNEVSYVPGE